MKRTTTYLMALAALLLMAQPADAQFLKKMFKKKARTAKLKWEKTVLTTMPNRHLPM